MTLPRTRKSSNIVMAFEPRRHRPKSTTITQVWGQDFVQRPEMISKVPAKGKSSTIYKTLCQRRAQRLKSESISVSSSPPVPVFCPCGNGPKNRHPKRVLEICSCRNDPKQINLMGQTPFRTHVLLEACLCASAVLPSAFPLVSSQDVPEG